MVQEPLDELEEALLAGEVQARVSPAVARVDVPGAEEVAQAAEIIRFGALVHRRVLRREDLRALDVLLVLEVVDAVADGPRLWLLRVLLAEHLERNARAHVTARAALLNDGGDRARQ